ncbi:hypothetical protein ACKWTF_001957 [Chironomus riparius]
MKMHREEFDMFVQEVNQYVYELTNQSKSHSKLKNFELAILSIELLIMQKMKKMCKAYVTGLLDVGVAKRDDVIDLHVVLGDNYYKKSDPERDYAIIGVIRDILDLSDHWRVLRISDESSIECECYLTNQIFLLSIGNGLKIEQYKLLKHIFSIQPEAITFYHFIRHWIIEKSVCTIDPKHLLLLVVFFLQKYGYMPSLFDVFLNVPKVTIDDYQVQFDQHRNFYDYNLKRMEYYRKHVLKFFNYYRSFDFYYHILNLHRGYTIGLKKYWRYLNNTAALNIIFVELENNFAPNTKFYQLTDFTRICDVSFKLFDDF